jgi:hypothetical protein
MESKIKLTVCISSYFSTIAVLSNKGNFMFKKIRVLKESTALSHTLEKSSTIPGIKITRKCFDVDLGSHGYITNDFVSPLSLTSSLCHSLVLEQERQAREARTAQSFFCSRRVHSRDSIVHR